MVIGRRWRSFRIRFSSSGDKPVSALTRRPMLVPCTPPRTGEPRVTTERTRSGRSRAIATSKMRNIPEKGFFNYNPGAYFGIYNMDTFWIDESKGG